MENSFFIPKGNKYPKNVEIDNDNTLESVEKLIALGAIDNVTKDKFTKLIINDNWVVVDIEPSNNTLALDQETINAILEIVKVHILTFTNGGIHLWVKAPKTNLKSYVSDMLGEDNKIRIEYKKKDVFLKNNYEFLEIEEQIIESFLNYELPKVYEQMNDWKYLTFYELQRNVNRYIQNSGISEEEGRNNFINKIAFICKVNGVDKDTCEEILNWQNKQFSQELNKKEIISTLNSAYK